MFEIVNQTGLARPVSGRETGTIVQAFAAGPGQLYGVPTPWGVSWSNTNHRVRVERPSGVISFVISNPSGVELMLIFNAETTTDADNRFGVAFQAASAGLVITGPNYHTVPAGAIAMPFHFHPDDPMVTADIKPVAAVTGRAYGVTIQ